MDRSLAPLLLAIGISVAACTQSSVTADTDSSVTIAPTTPSTAEIIEPATPNSTAPDDEEGSGGFEPVWVAEDHPTPADLHDSGQSSDLAFLTQAGEILVVNEDGSTLWRASTEDNGVLPCYRGTILTFGTSGSSQLLTAWSPDLSRSVSAPGTWDLDLSCGRFQIVGDSQSGFELIDLKQVSSVVLDVEAGELPPRLGPDGAWLITMREQAEFATINVAQPDNVGVPVVEVKVPAGWTPLNLGFVSDDVARITLQHDSEPKNAILELDMAAETHRLVITETRALIGIGQRTAIPGLSTDEGNLVILDPADGREIYRHPNSVSRLPETIGDGFVMGDDTGWWFVDGSGNTRLLDIDNERHNAIRVPTDEIAIFSDSSGTVGPIDLTIFTPTGGLVDAADIVPGTDYFNWYDIRFVGPEATASFAVTINSVDYLLVLDTAGLFLEPVVIDSSIRSPVLNEDATRVAYVSDHPDDTTVDVNVFDRTTGQVSTIATLPQGWVGGWTSQP